MAKDGAKPRSAAQKRNDRRLARMARGGGRRRASSAGAAPRRRRKIDSYDLGEGLGGLAVAYGLLVNGNQTEAGGNSIVGAVRALDPGKLPNAIGRTVQELRAPGSMTRAQVAGGAAVWAGAKIIRALAPSLHRVKFKAGKRVVHLI